MSEFFRITYLVSNCSHIKRSKISLGRLGGCFTLLHTAQQHSPGWVVCWFWFTWAGASTSVMSAGGEWNENGRNFRFSVQKRGRRTRRVEPLVNVFQFQPHDWGSRVRWGETGSCQDVSIQNPRPTNPAGIALRCICAERWSFVCAVAHTFFARVTRMSTHAFGRKLCGRNASNRKHRNNTPETVNIILCSERAQTKVARKTALVSLSCARRSLEKLSNRRKMAKIELF